MNNKIQNIKIKILIPYRSYDDLNLIYRKPKQMSKLEAIILSFIYVYSTDKKYMTEYFFEKLYERLNLNRNKWHDFILLILKKLSTERIIINDPDFKNDNLLCYEVTLNENVVNNLNENKFISIDSKDIVENLTFNKIIFESTDENKNHIIINKKLNVYQEYGYENEIKYLINFIEKNSINKSDENEIITKAKQYENDHKYFLEIKEFNKSKYIIKFNPKEIEDIQLSILDNEFSLTSSNKNNEDIINKYREHTLDNLLFYTFKENDKYLNDLEQKDEYDLIPNINEYQSIVNNKNSFSKYNKDQQKICLLDGSIYQMNKKWFYWKTKNDMSINLLVLNKQSLLNHIMNEIDKYINGECIDLIEYLSEDDKNAFNDFISSKAKDFLTNNKIKKYYIENVLTSEIENITIWTLLNLNCILLDDWKLIMKKLNKSKVDSFLEEYKNQKGLEEKLTYEKVAYLIELNNLEIFENYFKLEKFENLINYLNDLHKLSKNDEIKINKLIENKNLIVNKIKNEIKFDYESNKKYKDIYEVINNKINTIKKQTFENYIEISSKMSRKLETILKNNERLNYADMIKNYVKNEKLKKELIEIKNMRNEFAHSTEELPDENSSVLLDHVQKIEEKIKWLEANRERIKDEIEKNKSEKKEEEK